jgi:hypothetical protein
MAKEIYIAGEWRLGRGAVIQSLFPADQSVNACTLMRQAVSPARLTPRLIRFFNCLIYIFKRCC